MQQPNTKRVIDDGNKKAVITGDFKLDEDSTVDSFEHVKCDLLVIRMYTMTPLCSMTWSGGPPKSAIECSLCILIVGFSCCFG